MRQLTTSYHPETALDADKGVHLVYFNGRSCVQKRSTPEKLAGDFAYVTARDAELAISLLHNEHHCLAQIDSPYVPKPHDIRTRRTGVFPFAHLILDYTPGQDLHDSITHLNEHDLFGILEDTARAIKDCHDAGVQHHDIKPSNIIYDPATRTISLIDFGIAKRDSVDYTKQGLGVIYDIATPDYQPPEQAVRTPSQATDVWQLANTAYFGILTYAKNGTLKESPNPNLRRFSELNTLLQQAIKSSPRERPSIDDMIASFSEHRAFFSPPERHGTLVRR